MKRYKFIIAVGLLNVIHGGVHIFQFIQSLLLSYYSIYHKDGHFNDGWIHKILENPWMGLIWGILGIVTLCIGYRDYKHHKIHKD